MIFTFKFYVWGKYRALNVNTLMIFGLCATWVTKASIFFLFRYLLLDFLFSFFFETVYLFFLLFFFFLHSCVSLILIVCIILSFITAFTINIIFCNNRFEIRWFFTFFCVDSLKMGYSKYKSLKKLVDKLS